MLYVDGTLEEWCDILPDWVTACCRIINTVSTGTISDPTDPADPKRWPLPPRFQRFITVRSTVGVPTDFSLPGGGESDLEYFHAFASDRSGSRKPPISENCEGALWSLGDNATKHPNLKQVRIKTDRIPPQLQALKDAVDAIWSERASSEGGTGNLPNLEQVTFTWSTVSNSNDSYGYSL